MNSVVNRRMGMSSTQEMQFQEIRALVQTCHHHLLRLATSLEGQLAPAEEDVLAELFQVQINLQGILDDMQAAPPPDMTASQAPVEERATDRIAYAQAMQYARDLVKAMRQKKEHQHRLELTSQQLIRAEKLATIGQVAAAIAHELGNIFTPLLMYAKLVYEETADLEGSDAAEFALQITQIAQRASHMLRELVDASRRESTLAMPIDLSHTVRNTLNLLAPQIKESNIKVACHYPDNIPLVMGRPDQLEQVFINIVRNAFDAMPDGGNLTITIETGHEKNDLTTQSDFVAIRFSDTGEGIPHEHALNINPV